MHLLQMSNTVEYVNTDTILGIKIHMEQRYNDVPLCSIIISTIMQDEIFIYAKGEKYDDMLDILNKLVEKLDKLYNGQ